MHVCFKRHAFNLINTAVYTGHKGAYASLAPYVLCCEQSLSPVLLTDKLCGQCRHDARLHLEIQIPLNK